MSTKTLLPSASPISITSSSHYNDRYFFRSQPRHGNYAKSSTKNKPDVTSTAARKRYRFTPNNNDPYSNIYKFPTEHTEPSRSQSAGNNRYCFATKKTTKQPRSTLAYARSVSNFEQYSLTSTCLTDTPYLFSKPKTDTQLRPSTTATYVHSQDISAYAQSQKYPDSTMHRSSSQSPKRGQSRRLDTVTSTNGSLSKIKRPRTDKNACVHFESWPISVTQPTCTYINEAYAYVDEKPYDYSLESLDKSINRPMSSINENNSLTYITEYHIKPQDQSIIDYPSESTTERKHPYNNLHSNRTHTQIMKNLHKSVADNTNNTDNHRFKQFHDNVRRCLRSCESQSLQRELNYNLIRCFSSSYLNDLRQEQIRHTHARNHMPSYTYEDIQDIHVPTVLEAYKMKISIDRTKHQPSSMMRTRQPSSSSSVSHSTSERLETQSTGFDPDRKTHTSVSQPTTNVDLFYEIMQDSFVGIDMSIAGHVTKATEFTKDKRQKKNQPTTTTIHADIQTYSSIWSDDDIEFEFDFSLDTNNQRKVRSNPRQISRYLSTVNRSLLDRPGDLIADFYLSKLNRNMQDSVRNVETIAHDKADKHEFIQNRNKLIDRSLSAEHLYQVRKEHIRYKQSFKTPTSFTTEDVSDIYKPFVLENYKRKIAIELERRRKARQEQSPMENLRSREIDINCNVLKCSHPPVINTRPPTRDFSMVSPCNIVQTKEIVMGRARRTLIDDGSDDIVHHIGVTSPPTVYSVRERSVVSSSLPERIDNLNEVPFVTIVPPPDFADRQKRSIPFEQEHTNRVIDRGSPQPPITIARRPKTKIYTYVSDHESDRICHAKRIHCESADDHFATATIKPIVTINQSEINQIYETLQQTQQFDVQQNDHQYATVLVPSEPSLAVVDQSHNQPITYFNDDSMNSMAMEDYVVVVEQENPMYDHNYTTDVYQESPTFVHTVSPDEIEALLRYYRQDQQPVMLNTSYVNTIESPLDEQTKDIQEPLPVYEKLTVKNEIADIDLIAETLDLQIFEGYSPLASFFDQLTTTIQAKEIIDNNTCLKTNEKYQDNFRISIIVDDKEWADENLQLIFNDYQAKIENAQENYCENEKYEQIKINHQEQYVQPFDHEQATSFIIDNNYGIEQQANIHIDELSRLENINDARKILTLNYPSYKCKKTSKAIISRKHIENNSIDSSISTFIDMEIFLNHFEQSLELEQHLPLVDHVSISYATTSPIDLHGQNNRALPMQWLKPVIQPHDEQLVEQWTFEKDIDTIQHEGTIRRQHCELLTNAECDVNIIAKATINDNCLVEDDIKTSYATHENNCITDVVTNYSPTSYCETDTIEKDNETATSTGNNVVIIPTPSTTNILPASSITNTNASSSSPLTVDAKAAAPIKYFLDALAADTNRSDNNLAKTFLLTLGFGQNEKTTSMNEITNAVSTVDQLQLPMWIDRPQESTHSLKTWVHQDERFEKLHFADQHQITEGDIASIICPHRLQHGHDLGDNIQGPLNTYYESSNLQLPIVNEIYIYQLSIDNEFRLYHLPDVFPHTPTYITHSDDIAQPCECKVNKQKQLTFIQSHDLSDSEEDVQTISSKFDPPTYIEHYYVQSLFPFPETCYANIFEPDIINKYDDDFLASIHSRLWNQCETEHELSQFDDTVLMKQKASSNQTGHENWNTKSTMSTAVTESKK